MKRISKLAMAVLLLAVMMFANVETVCAQGSTTIYLSTNDAIGVGDSVSVTIKGTESSSVTVKYTDAVLSFVSCTNDSYKTDGNSIIYTGKEATIKFSGKADGKANVIVSSDALTGSSAQITVSGGGTAATEEPAEENPVETEETTTEETTTETSEPVTFEGAAVGPITVATAEAPLSDHLVEAAFVTEDGQTVSAYRLQNTESDFYYFYGTDEEGNGAWYCYDGANHTLQRADATVFAAIGSASTEATNTDAQVSESTEEEEAVSWQERAVSLYKSRKAVLIILFILLIAGMVFLNIHLKKRDEEYDDDEDDFFEEYQEAQERRDAMEHVSTKHSEPEVKTVVAGKEGFSNPKTEDIPQDLSAALEETVRATKAEASREVAAATPRTVAKPTMKQPTKQDTIADDIDLSDAIIKQVTKPSHKQDEDDLTIIDFNDL